MQIIQETLLDDFKRKHADARTPLKVWKAAVELAEWSGPQDIKDTFRSADFLSGNRVIFNIKGNRYRLVIEARYRKGLVIIEWVGTHAEYSKRIF